MSSEKPLPEELENTVVETLGEAKIPSPLHRGKNLYTDDSARVLAYSQCDINDKCRADGKEPPSFEIAGPREKIFFDPKEINCGIVTCGGLCPGINDVIRTITLSLIWQYGVKKVFGFRYGYNGLSENPNAKPIELTPEVVDEIQHEGGTILGSSRGPQDIGTMVDTLVKYKINILFAIGGDGTFLGVHNIAQEIKKRGLEISIIGIPKTIDNDIYCSEKTFGFSTAVGEARRSIYIAHEEAKAAFNGIGLVKLMGRDSGFISAYATLADSDVNFCLIPEVPLVLDGPCGFLRLLEERLNKKHHAVIVVAEGVGQDLIKTDSPKNKDASGNVRYQDIGVFIKQNIKEYLKAKNVETTIKYIDPSYIIRSCPANAEDSAFCILLGQNAVHAGMSGRTDMFAGYWNHHFTDVPLSLAITKKKHVDTNGVLWQTLLQTTGQSCDSV